jgi:hypothetical protein
VPVRSKIDTVREVHSLTVDDAKVIIEIAKVVVAT